ncbi:MAG: NAD(+)/NADH kinase [Candidatus Heimdallarchaeaceae archaeon]
MALKGLRVLIASSGNARAIDYALSTCDYLIKKDVTVVLDYELHKLNKSCKLASYGEDYDLIIVFGGDGTILRTFSHWKKGAYLGVNCGRVGFLTEVTPENIFEALTKIDNNEFFYEDHSAASVSSEVYPSVSALNDVVVNSDKLGRIITLKIEINNKHLYTLSGNGIIVSTNAGSSAYALSAGGSLIMPDVDAFILVPVCTFLGKTFPVVISPDSTITITNLSKYRAPNVIVDGQLYYTLGYKESIMVTRSPDIIRFIRFTDNFVDRVRSKLIKLNPDDLYG